MHIKQYHKRYNADRKHMGRSQRSLRDFARFAARFGDKEGDEARRWLEAKGIKAEDR